MDTPVVAPVSSHSDEIKSPAVPFFKNKKLMGTGGVLVVLLILLIVGFVFLKGSMGGLYGVKVFEGQYTSGKVLEFGLLGLKEKRIAVEGELSDYAESGTTQVAIVRNPEAQTQDVVLLSPQKKQLTSNGVGKAAVSVSPGGKYVAYAQRADQVVGGDFNPQISAWSIIVLNTATGEVSSLGQGFAPHFYETEEGALKILYTTRTGVSSVDLATKAVRSFDFIHPGVVDYAATISTDGKYLAIPNGLTKIVQIFELTESETEFSVELRNVGNEAFVHGAFVGHIFVGVARSEQGAGTLWSISVAEDKTWSSEGTLPANSHYRIIY